MMMMKMMRMLLCVLGSVCVSQTEVAMVNSGTTFTYLCMGNTITHMPTHIPKNTTDLEFKQTHIRVFPREAFTSLQQLTTIVLTENGMLESIGAFAFANLPRLTEITITKSKHLVIIHQQAFMGLPKLKYLTICNTGLRVLPNFSQIHSTALKFLLDLQDNVHIVIIPSNAFLGLTTNTIDELRLTKNGISKVESHAFNGTKIHKLFLMGNLQLSHMHNHSFKGAEGPGFLDISHTAVSSLPESVLGEVEHLSAVSVFSLRALPPLFLFTKLRQANLTYSSHCCAFHKHQRNRTLRMNSACFKPGAQNNHHFFMDYCLNWTSVACSPTPDAFNPCEDIMGSAPLRVLIWVISVLALLGNTIVLLVLLGSRAKMTVPRFLMCHLSFADLCMGVYLLVIATVDMRTRGLYYNHAISWQTGAGCDIAGFFTVFASELSVFTLTAITLERCHTITHALRLDRKLRLRHACAVMATGWAFSCLAALLPTVGVSSYSKVSICLPMDVESLPSQMFVMSLLLLNVVAFLCVCVCYLSIYLSVHNPSSPPASAETRMAQRMAILIFTDFLCMAPISFFALSAALKLPLITVSDSKLLLVLFYPINSCANPFLYGLCTRTFRRDFFLLAARYGLFTTKAQIYRTESFSVQQAAWIQMSPKASHGMLY
ncbi:follicle-stimulating hormone receptor [Coregonus clupeaformis]|uniref:follicle-stimulating hormone receptor n=1 Tax=Coregonus clupeaformis TaxID=59861 RepID=UPI001BE12885|nr:follicle-stimulating hormone receptor [Coregonus clupeaformis]